jgi:2-keto-4-pentenoate hydratase
MLEGRSRLLADGDRVVGWKLAFGAPHWLERLGTEGPLVGYLPEANVRAPGAAVSCEGWVGPVAEPEIAVYLGGDVTDPDRVVESISGLGPAIELADVDFPPEQVEEALAGNIFHRAVVLGEPDHSRVDGSLDGLVGRITRNGEPFAEVGELGALTGRIVPILGHVARLLEAEGIRLRAGEVIITGSVVPPIPVRPGDVIGFELAPLPPISVRV